MVTTFREPAKIIIHICRMLLLQPDNVSLLKSCVFRINIHRFGVTLRRRVFTKQQQRNWAGQTQKKMLLWYSGMDKRVSRLVV
jgi:hypothetical protein